MQIQFLWGIMFSMESHLREVYNMAESTESKNFIQAFIEEDIAPGGQYERKTDHTPYPPEPNP